MLKVPFQVPTVCRIHHHCNGKDAVSSLVVPVRSFVVAEWLSPTEVRVFGRSWPVGPDSTWMTSRRPSVNTLFVTVCQDRGTLFIIARVVKGGRTGHKAYLRVDITLIPRNQIRKMLLN
jgi:hypothetical protein